MKARLKSLPFPSPFLGHCTVFSLLINKCVWRVLVLLALDGFCVEDQHCLGSVPFSSAVGVHQLKERSWEQCRVCSCHQ